MASLPRRVQAAIPATIVSPPTGACPAPCANRLANCRVEQRVWALAGNLWQSELPAVASAEHFRQRPANIAVPFPGPTRSHRRCSPRHGVRHPSPVGAALRDSSGGRTRGGLQLESAIAAYDSHQCIGSVGRPSAPGVSAGGQGEGVRGSPIRRGGSESPLLSPIS